MMRGIELKKKLALKLKVFQVHYILQKAKKFHLQKMLLLLILEAERLTYQFGKIQNYCGEILLN